MSNLVRLAAIATLPMVAQPVWAWGDKGHEIIATIARNRLTPATKTWVDAILTQDVDTLTAPDMVSRATWADKWRDSGHRETADWHFVDLELAKPSLKSACFGNPTPASPPSAGPAEDCVVDKIQEFAQELGDPATPQVERILALKYVLHFVGDVHQPLHSSDDQDRGGNCVAVTVNGKTSNLHSFWDTGVLASLGSDPATAAATLAKSITSARAAAWSKGTPSSWAQEAYQVAKASSYTVGSTAGCPKNPPPIALTGSYQANALKAAELQIERAGVRLAWVLNTAASMATR